MIVNTNPNTGRLLAFVALTVGGVLITPALCQRAKAAGSKVRAAKRQENPPITFGDVTISRFVTGTFKVNDYAIVEGPNLTVDTVDPQDANSKTKLQAHIIRVFMDSKTLQSKRLEAEGSVRISGTRPSADKKSVQTFEGTGSKGVYLRTEGRMVLEGPVTFRGEQPATDGKSKQTVTGTAASATFDEKNNIISLEGGFEAKLFDPANLRGPAMVQGGKLEVNLASSPYEYKIHADKTHGKLEFQPLQKPKKKENK